MDLQNLVQIVLNNPIESDKYKCAKIILSYQEGKSEQEIERITNVSAELISICIKNYKKNEELSFISEAPEKLNEEENNEPFQKNKNSKIFTWILSVVFAACIGYFVQQDYFNLFPPKSMKVIHVNGSDIWCCNIEDDDESYSMFQIDETNSINFYLENLNSSEILVKDLKIRIDNYKPLAQIYNIFSSGMGGDHETYYYISVIESKQGNYAVEYIGEESELDFSYSPPKSINESYGRMSNYITVHPQSMDEFIVFLKISDEGIYDISLEIEYVYKQKNRKIKTKSTRFVAVDKETFYEAYEDEIIIE